MKKWVTLLLCCALAMGFAACGADMPGGQENGDSPENRLHFEVIQADVSDSACRRSESDRRHKTSESLCQPSRPLYSMPPELSSLHE